MKKMTEQHLINAFAGESQAHMRYLHFGIQASRENFPNVARLFKAISHAEFVHGEEYEINEMYPTYIEVAKFQDEKVAQRSFEWAYGTEKMHRKLFKKAQEAVEANHDVELGPIQICEVCGYTLEGEAPDICPLCGVGKEKFIAFP